MIMTYTYNIRRACVCDWRGFVFLAAVPLSQNERLTKTSMSTRRERASERERKKVFKLQVFTTNNILVARLPHTRMIGTLHFSMGNREKYSRENAVLSQRSFLFEKKTKREDAPPQNSHFKKWPIVLHHMQSSRACYFLFFFFFSSSLLHFAIIHTQQ